MDELSPLFHDIEFRERLRGYDVEEVDAYIDRIAKAAALVQGRIAELQERAEAAEARLTQRAAPVEGEESMSRMLLLAQRTADAAVAEARLEAAELLARANEEAARVRSEADEYSSRVLAEAETDRRRAVAEAEAAAEQAVAQEAERVTAAVAELEQYRSFLTEDIEILERHLADSRAVLASSLSGLADLLETPEIFRAPPMPATSGALAPEAVVVSTEETGALDEPPAADAPLILDEPPAADAPLILDESAADAGSALTPSGRAGVSDPDPEPSEPEPTIDLSRPAAELTVETRGPDDHPEEPGASDHVDTESLVPVAEAPIEGVDRAGDSAADGAGRPVADEEAADLADDEASTLLEFDPIDLTVAPIDLADLEPEPHPEPPLGAEPPRLITAADIEVGDTADEWMRGGSVDAGPITEPVPAVTDQLLFDEPNPAPIAAADPFLEQLREAVSRDDTDEFGDDALAAFFDNESDDGGRSWFPGRR